MKTNRSSSIAKKNMRKKGATGDRPEQLLVKEILEYHVTGTVTTEVKLKGLEATDALDFTGEKTPRIDIVLELKGFPIFLIRVNGPSHDPDKREKYDRAQKIFLESQKISYRVIDVSYVRHEILFERNRRKLTKYDYDKQSRITQGRRVCPCVLQRPRGYWLLLTGPRKTSP